MYRITNFQQKSVYNVFHQETGVLHKKYEKVKVKN